MGNQKLRIKYTLSSRDPHEQEIATHDLESAILRLAVDNPESIESGALDPEQQRAEAGTILIEVLPPIISGLSAVVSAFMASRSSVTVKVYVRTADDQTIYQGAADEIPETITTEQHGPGTPAEAEAEPSSTDGEQ